MEQKAPAEKQSAPAAPEKSAPSQHEDSLPAKPGQSVFAFSRALKLPAALYKQDLRPPEDYENLLAVAVQNAEVVESGRHAVLRGQWGNPCRFKSGLRHQRFLCNQPLLSIF